MRRRRKQTNKSDYFRSEPFSALKEIRSGEPILSGQHHIASEAPSDDDENKLFLDVLGGMKQIYHSADDRAVMNMSGARQKGIRGTHPDEDEGLFLQEVNALGVSSFEKGLQDKQDHTSKAGIRSSSSLLRQFKRGLIDIAAELDLHGYTRDEAIRRLESFILRSYNSGMKVVLVITGKGLNSPDGPVLSVAVGNWLKTSGRSTVAEFHASPRNRGGSGAYIVFLRKNMK